MSDEGRTPGDTRPLAVEIAQARQALIALLGFREGFVHLFRADRAGVILSLGAILAVMPIVMLGQVAQVTMLYQDRPEAPIVALIVNRLISQVIQVSGFALIMRFFLSLYGKEAAWFGLMTAYNWLRAVRMVAFVPLLFLATAVPGLLILLPLFKLYTLSVLAFLINRQAGLGFAEVILIILIETLTVLGGQMAGDQLALI